MYNELQSFKLFNKEVGGKEILKCMLCWHLIGKSKLVKSVSKAVFSRFLIILYRTTIIRGQTFDFWKCRADWVREKKILQGNTWDTMALYVREKNSITRDLEEKNSNVNHTGP